MPAKPRNGLASAAHPETAQADAHGDGRTDDSCGWLKRMEGLDAGTGRLSK